MSSRKRSQLLRARKRREDDRYGIESLAHEAEEVLAKAEEPVDQQRIQSLRSAVRDDFVKSLRQGVERNEALAAARASMQLILEQQERIHAYLPVLTHSAQEIIDRRKVVPHQTLVQNLTNIGKGKLEQSLRKGQTLEMALQNARSAMGQHLSQELSERLRHASATPSSPGHGPTKKKVFVGNRSKNKARVRFLS